MRKTSLMDTEARYSPRACSNDHTRARVPSRTIILGHVCRHARTRTITKAFKSRTRWLWPNGARILSQDKFIPWSTVGIVTARSSWLDPSPSLGSGLMRTHPPTWYSPSQTPALSAVLLCRGARANGLGQAVIFKTRPSSSARVNRRSNRGGSLWTSYLRSLRELRTCCCRFAVLSRNSTDWRSCPIPTPVALT